MEASAPSSRSSQDFADAAVFDISTPSPSVGPAGRPSALAPFESFLGGDAQAISCVPTSDSSFGDESDERPLLGHLRARGSPSFVMRACERAASAERESEQRPAGEDSAFPFVLAEEAGVHSDAEAAGRAAPLRAPSSAGAGRRAPQGAAGERRAAEEEEEEATHAPAPVSYSFRELQVGHFAIKSAS